MKTERVSCRLPVPLVAWLRDAARDIAGDPEDLASVICELAAFAQAGEDETIH